MRQTAGVQSMKSEQVVERCRLSTRCQDRILHVCNESLKGIPIGIAKVLAVIVHGQADLPIWLKEQILAQISNDSEIELKSPVADAIRFLMVPAAGSLDFCISPTFEAHLALVRALRIEADIEAAVLILNQLSNSILSSLSSDNSEVRTRQG